MKITLAFLAYLFCYSTFAAELNPSCDLPERYKSLCNYKFNSETKIPDLAGAVGLGVSAPIYSSEELRNGRHPAQFLLKQAFLGNTDAMDIIGNMFDEKDWKDYWREKSSKTLGLPRFISRSVLDKLDANEIDNYFDGLKTGYDALARKQNSKRIKDQLYCNLYVYMRDAKKLDELDNDGAWCAIRRNIPLRESDFKRNGNYPDRYLIDNIIARTKNTSQPYEYAMKCALEMNGYSDRQLCKQISIGTASFEKYLNGYLKAVSSELSEISNDTLSPVTVWYKYELYSEFASDLIHQAIKDSDFKKFGYAKFIYERLIELPIPLEDRYQKIMEYAVLLDPAFYDKNSSYDKIVDLLLKYMKNGDESKYGYFGRYRFLTGFLAGVSGDKAAAALHSHNNIGLSEFNFRKTSIYTNNKTVSDKYLLSSEAIIREVSTSLRRKGLCVNRSWEYPRVASCSEFEKDKNDAEKAKNDSPARVVGELMDAISAWAEAATQADLVNFQDFKKNTQVPNDNANYSFDRLFLVYHYNLALPAISLLNKLESKYGERYFNLSSLPDETHESLRKIKLNKNNCKLERKFFRRCVLNKSFDVRYLATLPEYSNAINSGSIYALIANGVLTPRQIMQDGKDVTLDIRAYKYHSYILPMAGGHLFMESDRDDKFKSFFLFNRDQFTVRNFGGIEHFVFSIRYFSDALEKYRINHKLKELPGKSNYWTVSTYPPSVTELPDKFHQP